MLQWRLLNSKIWHVVQWLRRWEFSGTCSRAQVPTCICLIEDFEYSTCQLTKDVWNWLCFIFKTQLCKSSFQIHRLVVIKEKGFLCFCQANFMFLVVGSTVKAYASCPLGRCEQPVVNYH